ncbi:MAG: NADPH-dependent glutamate synthase [Candidatus Omnitrophica bacterium]|nr:NADPH-dependent glutamate synthase [Candidatus Omnitrophota bacterium]
MDKRKRVPVAKQKPGERVKNFNEVSLGYSETEARQEASRCLQCKKAACIQGCPVGINIPEFIRFIREGQPRQSFKSLYQKNVLPAICGRVCPQETQCEQLCVLGKKGEPVAIGRLERFAADWAREHGHSVGFKGLTSDQVEGKVAVVGSGPAGLTCAAELANGGVSVTIFESLHRPGGVLVYGIPEFRLPKSIVTYEVDQLKKAGVEIVTDVVVGKTLTIPDLFRLGYQSVFVASGAGLPSFLRIPGENLLRVYSANEFLTRVNLMGAFRFPEADTPVDIGRRVAVIGGGNVAMDAARCSLRLSADEVWVLYRRTEEELPARLEEYENAKEEGIIFQFLVSPVEILGNADGYVTGVKVLRNQLGEPDESGRRRPVPVAGSETVFNFDTVIVAIGQNPNPIILLSFPQLKTGKNGIIEVDPETGATSVPGVFAGGDVSTGAATVISAMGAGKRAAKSIIEYLKLRQKGNR